MRPGLSWILLLVVCLVGIAADAQYSPNNPIKHVVVIVLKGGFSLPAGFCYGDGFGGASEIERGLLPRRTFRFPPQSRPARPDVRRGSLQSRTQIETSTDPQRQP